ncbi:hypothetical protein M2336_001236 [Sphingobium sp. B1D7B]|nr:hypothetical protein [Sphingobium sp. B1D7B]
MNRGVEIADASKEANPPPATVLPPGIEGLTRRVGNGSGKRPTRSPEPLPACVQTLSAAPSSEVRICRHQAAPYTNYVRGRRNAQMRDAKLETSAASPVINDASNVIVATPFCAVVPEMFQIGQRFSPTSLRVPKLEIVGAGSKRRLSKPNSKRKPSRGPRASGGAADPQCFQSQLQRPWPVRRNRCYSAAYERATTTSTPADCCRIEAPSDRNAGECAGGPRDPALTIRFLTGPDESQRAQYAPSPETLSITTASALPPNAGR